MALPSTYRKGINMYNTKDDLIQEVKTIDILVERKRLDHILQLVWAIHDMAVPHSQWGMELLLM